MINPYIYLGLPEHKQRLAKLNRKEYDPERIIEIVCEVLKVDKQQFLSPLRKREVSEARSIAIGIILQSCVKLTLKSIGAMLNRDHSTIIYARDTFNVLYKSDKSFTNKVNEVLKHV
jgi:chromosomal replication initiator protein